MTLTPWETWRLVRLRAPGLRRGPSWTAQELLSSAKHVRGIRFAELMLPLLIFPFLLPPVSWAAQITTRLLAGRPLSEIAEGMKLIGFYDLVFVTLCLLLFPSLMDE